MTVECPERTVEQVENWRELRLLEMGCAPLLARSLKGVRGLDLHEMKRLVDAGAHPKTAARILLPDDDWPRPL